MSDMSPAHVQSFLTGMRYPASRDDLINCARSEGADDSVMKTLQRMPSDRRFEGPAEVSQEVSNVL